jgi:hypothetical protein
MLRLPTQFDHVGVDGSCESRPAVTAGTPFHRPSDRVHHNSVHCPGGYEIEARHLRAGSGGRPLCPHCRQLAALGISGRYHLVTS